MEGHLVINAAICDCKYKLLLKLSGSNTILQIGHSHLTLRAFMMHNLQKQWPLGHCRGSFMTFKQRGQLKKSDGFNTYILESNP
jgi:hypothetical protein